MTPSARLSAAIEVLDRILAGQPAEQALTNWARGSRFAGSGDRAAVRDLVFEAQRCRRSFAALGGSETGRGLVLGSLRAAGEPVDAMFTGEGHAPAPVRPDEAAPEGELPELVALDCPEWLAPGLRASLGKEFPAVMGLLRHRAPVFLRVNPGRGTREQVQRMLEREGIRTEPHPLAATALEVIENARRIQSSQAYASGIVELQDAASQAVVEALPGARRVLDYCAGGGGKALALASRGASTVFAHDADPRRMRDLPQRAARAGVRISLLEGDGVDRAGPFDLVLADVPCSGSGSWRRSPDGKWALTEDGLERLLKTQSDILDRAAVLVAQGGHLAYATCSLLDAENFHQVEGFLARTIGWNCVFTKRFTPLDGGDGFFLAVLARS